MSDTRGGVLPGDDPTDPSASGEFVWGHPRGGAKAHAPATPCEYRTGTRRSAERKEKDVRCARVMGKYTGGGDGTRGALGVGRRRVRLRCAVGRRRVGVCVVLAREPRRQGREHRGDVGRARFFGRVNRGARQQHKKGKSVRTPVLSTS